MIRVGFKPATVCFKYHIPNHYAMTRSYLLQIVLALFKELLVSFDGKQNPCKMSLSLSIDTFYNHTANTNGEGRHEALNKGTTGIQFETNISQAYYRSFLVHGEHFCLPPRTV